MIKQVVIILALACTGQGVQAPTQVEFEDLWHAYGAFGEEAAGKQYCAVCMFWYPPTSCLPAACGHKFCAPCYARLQLYGHVGCPLCRARMDNTDLNSDPSDDPIVGQFWAAIRTYRQVDAARREEWAQQQAARREEWAQQQAAQRQEWAQQQAAQRQEWALRNAAQDQEWALQSAAQNEARARARAAQAQEWAQEQAARDAALGPRASCPKGSLQAGTS